jgi:hypothetical protein
MHDDSMENVCWSRRVCAQGLGLRLRLRVTTILQTHLCSHPQQIRPGSNPELLCTTLFLVSRYASLFAACRHTNYSNIRRHINYSNIRLHENVRNVRVNMIWQSKTVNFCMMLSSVLLVPDNTAPWHVCNEQQESDRTGRSPSTAEKPLIQVRHTICMCVCTSSMRTICNDEA